MMVGWLMVAYRRYHDALLSNESARERANESEREKNERELYTTDYEPKR